MFSKRSLEGYIEIDHRESPGITPEQAAATGFVCLPVGKGMRYQSAMNACSHCQRRVVLNPNRTRERGYCPKCDKYLCDLCEAARVKTGVCRPFVQIVDEW